MQVDARIELLISNVGLLCCMYSRLYLKVLFIMGFAENAASSSGHLGAGTS